MKNLLETVDKKSLILSIIYKLSTYVCWYLFALIMIIFLNESFDRNRCITMILALFSVYTIRTIFKYYYKQIVDKSYYSIKHSCEMYYFKKLNKLNPDTLEKLDKEFLGNKMLEVAFNLTKAISDVCEFLIPTIIGLVIYFVVLSFINIFVAIALLLALCGILYYEYRKYEEEDSTNYNDLLIDFVNKLVDIRMLNAFSFCCKKLDKSTQNICVIRNNTKYDLLYEISMLAILLASMLATILLIKNMVIAFGFGLFFVVMGIKLKKLVFIIVPTLKNIRAYQDNKSMLDSYFNDSANPRFVNNWNKIVIKDANYVYESGINIKIPHFEFERGDNVSILGASGMGKSTLLFLLSGMYRITNGQTLIDNTLSTSAIDSMYITSNTKLFKISLRDNLTLGIKMSDEDLLKLIKEINIVDWYRSLSKGLDTIIDINYIDLPDIVREKINILRCIISDKETLLLDEPTYDLDMDSEKIIANMIKKYWKKKSYVIVSHKPIFTTICKKHYFMKNHELLESEPLL